MPKYTVIGYWKESLTSFSTHVVASDALQACDECRKQLADRNKQSLDSVTKDTAFAEVIPGHHESALDSEPFGLEARVRNLFDYLETHNKGLWSLSNNTHVFVPLRLLRALRDALEHTNQ